MDGGVLLPYCSLRLSISGSWLPEAYILLGFKPDANAFLVSSDFYPFRIFLRAPSFGHSPDVLFSGLQYRLSSAASPCAYHSSESSDGLVDDKDGRILHNVVSMTNPPSSIDLPLCHSRRCFVFAGFDACNPVSN